MNQDRPRIQQRLLRRALRRQYKRGEESERDLIQLALRDEAIFEPLYEQAMGQAKEYGTTTGQFSITADSSGTMLVDNLLKLLQWFVENGPELVKVIELIVGLFGGVAVAATVWADEQLVALLEIQNDNAKELS